MKTIRFISTLLLISFGLLACGVEEPQEENPTPQNGDQVLVFTKTAGFRHTSIEKGVATLKALGESNDYEVTHTEDAQAFSPDNLKKYQLVIFLSTTEDVLNSTQQNAFRQYIEGGGNYMGVHAATDTEYNWAWYGKLAGAYFKSHPEQQQARIEVVDKNHLSAAHLGDSWTHFDEWYNYKNISPDIQVILKLDESSYEGGENGDHHPIAWYQEFSGGRSFYTGLGHTEAAYDDPKFRQHLVGGILYCLGRD